LLRLYREAVVQWHRDNDAFLKTLRNDAIYRILVAVMLNVISPFQRPWRERAAFKADLFKVSKFFKMIRTCRKKRKSKNNNKKERTSNRISKTFLNQERNQVACSEFVIKAAFQCADLLGRNMARKLIESKVEVNVNPSGMKDVVFRLYCVVLFSSFLRC
jgi:hypothetical protein